MVRASAETEARSGRPRRGAGEYSRTGGRRRFPPPHVNELELVRGQGLAERLHDPVRLEPGSTGIAEQTLCSLCR